MINYRKKNILQHQQFAESLAELSEIIRIPFHQWWRLLLFAAHFWWDCKIVPFYLTFNKLLVLKNIFFSNSTSQHQNLHAVSNQITSKTIFAMFVALEWILTFWFHYLLVIFQIIFNPLFLRKGCNKSSFAIINAGLMVLIS